MQRTLDRAEPGWPARRPRFPVFPLLLCLGLLHCGSDAGERKLALYALKSQPTPENIGTIRERLADADRDVRATALNILVELDVPDAADLALDALDDSDGFVRATAAKLIGDLGKPALVEPLVPVLLEDPDPVARQRAAESLARLGGEEAVDALTRALTDPVERVRHAAVNAVSDLDPASALTELTRLLHDDTVWEIRAQAAHALGLTGDPRVLADLEQGLGDPNEFVRSAVANALRTHERVRERRGGNGHG